MKNILLAPDGGVYSCITGFCYFSDRIENNYYLGNILRLPLDEILPRRNSYESRKAVEQCKGCNSPCEWMREEKIFGVKNDFTEQETLVLKKFISQNEDTINLWRWFNGWHLAEKYDWGEMHWMSSKSAKVFYKVAALSVMQLNISYCNGMPDVEFAIPLALTLNVDSREILHNFILDKQGILKILLDRQYFQGEVIEVCFQANHLWRPSNYDGGSDNRNLGVAICSIEAY